MQSAPDRPDWRLSARDRETARRIEAARRLKQRYPGITIQYEWMIEAELQ
jgi:hypothetical protein